VDASDTERIEEVHETLYKVLEEEETKGVPLLIFANKMDVAQLNVNDLTSKL